jgi:hypothetical protein
MQPQGRWITAILAIALLSLAGCAATGTRVTTSSDTYRDMASSQQAWCSSMGSMSGCGCTMDGKPATCSLVQTCINAGDCKRAQ